MRLKDGTLWSIPIILDVTMQFADSIQIGSKIALRDPEGSLIAIQKVEEIYQPDLRDEAEKVYRTLDLKHPGVKYLLENTNPVFIGGLTEGVVLPKHYDFTDLRKSPDDLKKIFVSKGWKKVVAFQTRNPMHRAHLELTLKASRDCDSKILIHPVVGLTKPGDVDYYTRVRCYKSILSNYPSDCVELSLLPLAMRMAGPREALWHAQIRKNYGCSHFIVGRDHAGPGQDSTGKSFYDPYDAQALLSDYKSEIGIEIVPIKEMFYLEDEKRFVTEDKIGPNNKALRFSGSELRSYLDKGEKIPEWITYTNINDILSEAYPPRHKRGLVIFLTGLSGSGKSSLANILLSKFLEIGQRPVTLLDGDIIRQLLSSELGFSREHRELNIKRIGYVASQICKSGGIAICAQIAPYESSRNQVKEMVSQHGKFILVHLSTPLKVCEERDHKGLYAKARAGIISSFTGISDIYETPLQADLSVDSSKLSLTEEVELILRYLKDEGYIL